MNTSDWQRVQALVSAAAELPIEEQTPYLDGACEDASLRRFVDEMLLAYHSTSDTLQGVVGLAAARAQRSADAAAGDHVGAYELKEIIGRGGMGTVYRAERADAAFRQVVAIKLVRAAPGLHQELFARFRAERQILASINHPHIARLLDGGLTQAGLPYLVMEFVEGCTLDRYVREKVPSTVARLELFCCLCSAIQYAHQNLIVHRDLKPSNILVMTDGTPKLLDFGIAKLLAPMSGEDTVIFTGPAERMMTPEYASPEQILGGAITTATDVYGLGLVLYSLLTGRAPFAVKGLRPAEIERLLCETQPRPPSAWTAAPRRGLLRWTSRETTDLDRIVLKAMHREPGRRYVSAAALAADIQQYLRGFPVGARADTWRYRMRRFVARHTVAVGAALLVALTVVGLTVGLLVQAQRARQQARSAEAVSSYLVGLFETAMPDATQGRDVSARDLLDHGTEGLEKHWTGEPVVKARLLSTLGGVYFQMGSLVEADKLFRQSRAIYSREKGPASPEVADLSNSLGEAELEEGKYEDSLVDYSESVRIFEKTRPGSAQLADAMDGLSGILWEIGDYKESEKYHLLSVPIAVRTLGPDSLQTLVYKNNLQVLWIDMGRYREAEALGRELLATRYRLSGENNSHTASSLSLLGQTLRRSGKLPEAGALLERGLAALRVLHGREHPRIAKELMHLAQYYRDVGDEAQAEAYATRAVVMARSLLGERSLDTAADEATLGSVLLAEGNVGAARGPIEQAAGTRAAQRVPSIPLQSESDDQLGLLYLAEGKPLLAKKSIEQALAAREKFFAPGTDVIGFSYVHLGRVLEALGDPAGATTAYTRALAVAQTNFGTAPNLLTADALYGLGTSRWSEGQSAQARAPLEEALAMRRVLLLPVHPDLVANIETAKRLRRVEAGVPGNVSRLKTVAAK